MPFKSLKQSAAAFSGALGSKMKKDAPEWASKTDYKKLPTRVKGKSKGSMVSRSVVVGLKSNNGNKFKEPYMGG